MENGTSKKGDLTEQLTEELQAIANEAEMLIQSKSEDLVEKTKELRDKLASALDTANDTVESLETQAAKGIKAADRAIRSHPYQSLGIALGVGLAVGLLLKRRS